MKVKCSNFEPVERLIRDNLWICPINVKHQDDAFYSISKNEITVPEKVQFGTGKHSTEHCSMRWDIRLVRKVCKPFQPTSFGSKEYSDEELVGRIVRCIDLPTLRNGQTYKRGQLSVSEIVVG